MCAKLYKNVLFYEQYVRVGDLVWIIQNIFDEQLEFQVSCGTFSKMF